MLRTLWTVFGCVVSVVAVAGACSSDTQIASQTGEVVPGGACAEPGSRAPAKDGCNSCTCSDSREWACTEMACQDCTPGQQQPSLDGCNTCNCSQDGQWVCTDMACPSCTPGAQRFDGCNTCTCNESGNWACTRLACPTCEHGETKPAPDGCNTCTCVENGAWLCSQIPCPHMDAGPEPQDAGVGLPYECTLPFDSGPCEAAIPVYAFVNGSCTTQTYGGCQGNANRFLSLEECLATCVGAPEPGGCPPNRVPKEICLTCAPQDGCDKSALVCALLCQTDADCSTMTFGCFNGVCQADCTGACNPAFCPVSGAGTACCSGPDGPCGMDFGSGCVQAAP